MANLHELRITFCVTGFLDHVSWVYPIGLPSVAPNRLVKTFLPCLDQPNYPSEATSGDLRPPPRR